MLLSFLILPQIHSNRFSADTFDSSQGFFTLCLNFLIWLYLYQSGDKTLHTKSKLACNKRNFMNKMLHSVTNKKTTIEIQLE